MGLPVLFYGMKPHDYWGSLFATVLPSQCVQYVVILNPEKENWENTFLAQEFVKNYNKTYLILSCAIEVNLTKVYEYIIVGLGLDMAKRVRLVWPVTRLIRLKMIRFDPRPNWPNPNRPFYNFYQRWVVWDWDVIFIKYLLILPCLICYVLHYSLSFFTCHLHFFFLY